MPETKTREERIAAFQEFHEFAKETEEIEDEDRRYVISFGPSDFPNWHEPSGRATASQVEKKIRNTDPEAYLAIAYMFQAGDRMLAVDEDEPVFRERNGEDFQPTFRIRSRSGGTHLYYTLPDEDTNFPHDSLQVPETVEKPDEMKGDANTVADFRGAQNQKIMYIPGSHRPDPKGGYDGPGAGYYTITNNRPAADFDMRQMPRSWLYMFAENERIARVRKEERNERLRGNAENYDPDETDEDTSNFFDDKAGRHIMQNLGVDVSGEKFAHPIHGSTTGKNAQFDPDTCTLTCWRHNVALGPAQLLALDSEMYDDDSGCALLGKPHATGGESAASSAGPSDYIANPKAMFHAWKRGVEVNAVNGTEIPYKALVWVAIEHVNTDPHSRRDPPDPHDYDEDDPEKRLQAVVFNEALAAVRDYYGVEPNRDEVDPSEDIETDDVVASKPFKQNGLDVYKNQTLQGIARSGKSYDMIEAVYEARKQGFEGRVGYLLPSHQEGKSTWDKAAKFGLAAAYVAGKTKAKERWEVNTASDEYPDDTALTPWDAAEQIDEDQNQYQANIEGAKESDFVVLPPEKLDDVDPHDFDLLITSEEAVLSRLLSEELCVFKAKRGGGPAEDNSAHFLRLGDKVLGAAEKVKDKIEDLERTDAVHDDMVQAADLLLDIDEITRSTNFDVWNDLEGNEDADEDTPDPFDRLVETIRERAREVEPKANFQETRTRLKNYTPGHAEKLINALYHDSSEGRDEDLTNELDGVYDYGNGNEKAIYLVGDVDRVFADLPDDCNFWFAGNDLPAMQNAHELIHGEVPEAMRHDSEFTPVTRCMRVIRYSGGDTPKQQTGDIRKTIENLQGAGYGDRPKYAGLLFDGSGARTAQLASKTPSTYTPGTDSLDGVKSQQVNRNSVAMPANSRFAEGVDLQEYDFGAVHSAQFATPRQSYLGEETGEWTMKFSELIRATQNAALRASNVPHSGDPNGRTLKDGTQVANPAGTAIDEDEEDGTVPTIIPDKHIPEVIFDMFEAFGIDVETVENVDEATEEMEGYMTAKIAPDAAIEETHAEGGTRVNERKTPAEVHETIDVADDQPEPETRPPPTPPDEKHMQRM